MPAMRARHEAHGLITAQQLRGRDRGMMLGRGLCRHHALDTRRRDHREPRGPPECLLDAARRPSDGIGATGPTRIRPSAYEAPGCFETHWRGRSRSRTARSPRAPALPGGATARHIEPTRRAVGGFLPMCETHRAPTPRWAQGLKAKVSAAGSASSLLLRAAYRIKGFLAGRSRFSTYAADAQTRHAVPPRGPQPPHPPPAVPRFHLRTALRLAFREERRAEVGAAGRTPLGHFEISASATPRGCTGLPSFALGRTG